MKKNGILNADLAYELTRLRHFDYMVICDAGFPIPNDATVVDLSLIDGIPTVPQVLHAVLDEVIFQRVITFDALKSANPEYYDLINSLFRTQERQEMDMDHFREIAKTAKFYVRTGDTKPCANILLMSASGVKERADKYNVVWPSGH